MGFYQLYNVSHSNICPHRKWNLFHSQNFKRTLTNHEFMENSLAAISIFLLVIMLKDLINRIVYMRPRFSVAYNNITYFSQARIVLLDNSFLLRWVRKFRLCDVGH